MESNQQGIIKKENYIQTKLYCTQHFARSQESIQLKCPPPKSRIRFHAKLGTNPRTSPPSTTSPTLFSEIATSQGTRAGGVGVAWRVYLGLG
jgi:hypothetical protein